jgi:hypothetical protein
MGRDEMGWDGMGPMRTRKPTYAFKDEADDWGEDEGEEGDLGEGRSAALQVLGLGQEGQLRVVLVHQVKLRATTPPSLALTLPPLLGGRRRCRCRCRCQCRRRGEEVDAFSRKRHAAPRRERVARCQRQ